MPTTPLMILVDWPYHKNEIPVVEDNSSHFNSGNNENKS